MNNGQIDFGYTGFVKQRPYKLDFGYDYYDLYAVTGGKVDCNYDGIFWTTIDGTCFHQRVDTCTVSHDTHGINVILKGSDHIRRNVYKSNVGFFFLKLFCQGTSNFTAPNNNTLPANRN